MTTPRHAALPNTASASQPQSACTPAFAHAAAAYLTSSNYSAAPAAPPALASAATTRRLLS